MSNRGKRSDTVDTIEETTNGFGTIEKHNDFDEEAKPLQRNNRARRDSLAKIELQINSPPPPPPTVGKDSVITSNKSKGTYGSVMDNLKMPENRRLPFLLTVILCIILLIAIIVLVSFWPRIPYFMRAEICMDKECLDASKQILSWANTSVNVCNDPYQWACGKFQKEYEEHNSFGVHRGEWNMKSFLEYEEIRELNLFISMLPSKELSLTNLFPSAYMIKSLYESCREIETMYKSAADNLLRKAINSLGKCRHDFILLLVNLLAFLIRPIKDKNFICCLTNLKVLLKSQHQQVCKRRAALKSFNNFKTEFQK